MDWTKTGWTKSGSTSSVVYGGLNDQQSSEQSSSSSGPGYSELPLGYGSLVYVARFTIDYRSYGSLDIRMKSTITLSCK